MMYFPKRKYKELESLGREIGKELTVSHHYALRILFMSLGHKIGADRAFREKANAVFLGADLVTSDGTVKELERLMREGHKVVLTATLRFAQGRMLGRIQGGRVYGAGETLGSSTAPSGQNGVQASPSRDGVF